VNASFDGRGALVTGAAGDLGRAIVRALVDRGARVAMLDVDAEALHALERELGTSVKPIPCDVAEEAQVADAVAAATAFADGLDLVVSNAGIEGPVGPLEELDLTAFERVLRINVLGPAAVLKHVLPGLSRGACVVHTGSTASVAGAPHVAPYVASKHALLGLTRAASREVAARGIRVCAVLPGPIEGRMMERLDDRRATSGAVTSAASTVLDGGRYAKVEEVVAAVLFLLGPDAGFVAGTGLLVDGGRLA
jgi:NAD(P)-dependent dehydrogenase (short-subunit alcohol dehydrogenase family)